MTAEPTAQTAHFSISLFSGALGLDLGLEAAGLRLRLALEKDRAAVETIRLNRRDLPVINRSITEVSAQEILTVSGLKPEEVTLISAGPCCQSFSTAGKRHSVNDPRGDLFFDFCRIVRELRPRFFVMENVKGMLSAAVRHRRLNERGAGFPPLTKEEQLGSGLDLIREKLGELNYYVIFGLLNAADFGVPQKRWRVFFIGSRDGEDLYLPSATHCDPEFCPQTHLLPWQTLKSALHGIKSLQWCDFTEERRNLLSKLKAGQNWRDLPPRLHRKALGAAADSWGGRVGFCRRLSWNEPAPTLTTAPDGRATTLCHPSKLRPLSVEEYAALQTFPQSWKFFGSTRQQYMQIGNAVPVQLSAAVGRSIMKTLKLTEVNGLPTDAEVRKGKVICADPELDVRLKNRKLTQLHPPRLRKIKDPDQARQWLRESTEQPFLQFSEP
ncbi:MAG TPA: DNA cytosine methyltransferase [Candidatus Angelobacter sp.]|nr:DNA cytosine methyltransferase [Candidatus Angelobacter sp.]